MSQTRKNAIAPDASILVHIEEVLPCSALHPGVGRERTEVTAGGDGICPDVESAIIAVNLSG